mgnify:CR=1 FL=1
MNVSAAHLHARRIAEEVLDLLRLSRPPWAPERLRSFGMYGLFDSSKAEQELDYKIRPLEEIIRYEQRDYYRNAGLCYAEGWSIIYFLNTSREAQRHEVWSQILPTYFETLKSAWAEQLLRLEGEGKAEDETALLAARKEARDAAVDAAFEGVDLWELQKAWMDFVMEIPDPKERR